MEELNNINENVEGLEIDINPEYTTIGADPSNPEETTEQYRARLTAEFTRVLLL